MPGEQQHGAGPVQPSHLARRQARGRQRRWQGHFGGGPDPLPADIEERHGTECGATGAKALRILPPADAQRAHDTGAGNNDPGWRMREVVCRAERARASPASGGLRKAHAALVIGAAEGAGAVAKPKVHRVEERLVGGRSPKPPEDRAQGKRLLEGPVIAGQQLIGRERPRPIDHMAGVVERPIPRENAPFLGQAFVQPRAGIRRQNGIVGHFDLGAFDKLQRAVEDSLVIAIQPEHKRGVDADAVVVDAAGPLRGIPADGWCVCPWRAGSPPRGSRSR